MVNIRRSDVERITLVVGALTVLDSIDPSQDCLERLQTRDE